MLRSLVSRTISVAAASKLASGQGLTGESASRLDPTAKGKFPPCVQPGKQAPKHENFSLVKNVREIMRRKEEQKAETQRLEAEIQRNEEKQLEVQQDMDYCRMCQAEYEETDGQREVPGYTRLPVGNSVREDKKGFHATVWLKDDRSQVVVAYRGTVGIPKSTQDKESIHNWGTNFHNAIGGSEDPQRSENILAQGLARDIKQSLDTVEASAPKHANSTLSLRVFKILFGSTTEAPKTSPELVFTGHSLGGNLAASAAITTNTSAVTFNAAGMKENHALSHMMDDVPEDQRPQEYAKRALNTRNIANRGDLVDWLNRAFGPLPFGANEYNRLPFTVSEPIGNHKPQKTLDDLQERLRELKREREMISKDKIGKKHF